MILNKRYTERVGNKLVITDIEIMQRIVPAEVDFNDLLAAVQVKTDGITAYFEFAGYETDGDLDLGDNVDEGRLLLANDIADFMEFDGIKVLNRREIDL